MRRRARLFSSVWPALLAASVGCQAPVYANQQGYEIDGGERTPAGGACVPIGDWRSPVSSSSIGTADQDLLIAHDVSDDTLIVHVRSQGRLLEHREYSEGRLRTGKRDQFTIETNAGRTYELHYWGSDECELPPPEP